MQKYQLHLKGFVGGSDFDKGHVDDTLNENAGKPVTVLIDSLGGSLATALSIAASFRNHGDVTVHFVGFNASAATIASLGAKHISIDAHAMYLVHQCSTQFFEWASLNASQLQERIAHLEQAKSDLEKMDANVASMYAEKCKKQVCDLLVLMKKGGWLTAQEALDWGFVDEITNIAEDAAPELTDAVASAMASVGMPIPNMPTAIPEQSQFAKFLSALTAFFKPQTAEEPKDNNQPENNQAMSKILPFLAAVLAVEALQFENGVCTLTEAQCDALEKFLADKDKELKDAQAAVTEKDGVIKERDKTIASQSEQIAQQADLLAKKPGDTTSQVLNNGKPAGGEKDAVEEYFDTLNSATALFERLP